MAKKRIGIYIGVFMLAALIMIFPDFFGHPLVVALGGIGLAGAVAKWFALKWQNEYWERQEQATRAKEQRTAEFRYKLRTYEHFIRAYYCLAFTEAQEDFDESAPPSMVLCRAATDFTSARDIMYLAFRDSPNVRRKLDQTREALAGVTPDIAGDMTRLAEFLRKRQEAAMTVLDAAISNIMQRRSENPE